jgi:hypothetical protein
MAAPSADPPVTGTLVTVGSPASPFSQNKQNEPTVAIDANDPSVVWPAPTTTSTWRRVTRTIRPRVLSRPESVRVIHKIINRELIKL